MMALLDKSSDIFEFVGIGSDFAGFMSKLFGVTGITYFVGRMGSVIIIRKEVFF